MRSKKALYNITTNLLLQIVVIIYGFIVPYQIIKTYGSNVNGLLASITQFLSYITILDSGVGQVIKSILYKPIAEKNKNEVESILKSSQKFFNTICYIFIIYVIVLCFIYPIFVNSQFSFVYTISLIIIISTSTFAEYFLGIVNRLYLQAKQETYIISIIQLITTVLNTIICVVLIKLRCDIQIVKLVSILIFVMRPVIQNLYVKNKYNINYRSNKNTYKLRQKWDGFSQHLASVIHNNTDIAILTLFSTMSEISVYSVYLLVVNGLKNFVESITRGIDAAFGDIYARSKFELLNKRFKNYEFVYYTIITIIFSCSITLVIPFVSVYTTGLIDVNYIRYSFAYVFLLAEYFWALRLPHSSLIFSVGHFKETQLSAWIEAVLNIIVSLILVNKYGILGVAIGTLIAMLYRSISLIVYSTKKILKRPIGYSIKHITISIIEMAIVFTICNYFIKNIEFNSYKLWIVYGIIITIISTLIIAIINFILFKEQFHEVLEVVKKIIKKRKCKKNIQLNMSGRLGNQMFRYAAARSYMEKYNVEDIKIIWKNVYNRGFENNLVDFNICNYETIEKEKLKFIQKMIIRYINFNEKVISKINKDNSSIKINEFEMKFQKIFNKKGIYKLTNGYFEFQESKYNDVFLNSNFESSKYFNDYREVIIKEFTPKKEKLKKNKKLYDIIEKNESVCITIRRGDFLDKKFKNAHYVCTEEYFYKGIEKIKKLVKNPKFIVFSDDVEWCKNNMKFPKGTMFEDGNDPVWEKLRLMYSCKHFIISNSTFSWWAQYLSRNSDKVVIAPSRWKNTFQNEDIYEENWILIEP